MAETSTIYYRDREDHWLGAASWKLAPVVGTNEGDPSVAVHGHPGKEVTCWATFDADHFYFRGEVTAPWGSDGNRSWRYGDGFQLTISPDAVNGRTGRYTTIGCSLVKGCPEVVVVNRDGKWLLDTGPEGMDLAIAPTDDGGAIYELTIDWNSVKPLHGFIDGVMGLNVTYISRREQGRAFYQMVRDQDFDSESCETRRVCPFDLKIEELLEPVVRCRLRQTHGDDHDDAIVDIGYWSPQPVVADCILTARRESEGYRIHPEGMMKSRGAPIALPSSSGLSRSVAAPRLSKGMNVVPQFWRSRTQPGGRYDFTLEISVEGKAVHKEGFAFYKLRSGDLKELRDRYQKAARRVPHTISQSLPTVSARFDWIESIRRSLGPGDEPWALRELFTELLDMVERMEERRDPLKGVIGYQRRAFRSTIDGSTQPFSVHLPTDYYKDARPRPMLVMLHGSGVDEVKTAQNPKLVQQLEEYGWLLCAPKGRDLSGWYLGDCGRDVLEAVDAAARTLNVDVAQVFLGGFSMGGFGVWRLGLEDPRRFAGLVVLSGLPVNPLSLEEGQDLAGQEVAVASSPGNDDPARYLDRVRGLPVYVVHGDNDRATPVEPTRSFVKRLVKAGSNVTYKEIQGAGHGDYDAWPAVFRWMEDIRRSRG